MCNSYSLACVKTKRCALVVLIRYDTPPPRGIPTSTTGDTANLHNLKYLNSLFGNSKKWQLSEDKLTFSTITLIFRVREKYTW